jgi:hypothetical protein
VFAGWSGDADCLDGVVGMQGNLNCTATFATQTRNLTLQVLGSGQGSVISSPSGISCPGDCSGSYELGSVVTLMATPAAGSTFFGFSGAADCSDGIVTVNSNVACVAVFAAEPALHEDDFESADTSAWSLEAE